MSLSDLAALGNFISGIAVLLSFVFLALQLRQGNVNQRALIQTGRTSRLIDVIYRREDAHLRDILLRARRGDPTMLPHEIEAYLQVSFAALLNFEDTFLQAHAGTIHPEAWTTATARLKNLLVAPGFRVAWKKWRPQFGGDFIAAVDQIASQARLSGWQEPSTNWASDVAEEIRLSAR